MDVENIYATLDKLIEQVSPVQDKTFILWSTEIKELINKHYPQLKTVMLDSNMLENKEDKNTILIVSTYDKPLKLNLEV